MATKNASGLNLPALANIDIIQLEIKNALLDLLTACLEDKSLMSKKTSSGYLVWSNIPQEKIGPIEFRISKRPFVPS